MRRIDPTDMSPSDIKSLALYINKTSPDVILHDQPFLIGDTPYVLNNSLILDNPPSEEDKEYLGPKVYWVINNDESGLLGEGGFNKARASIGKLIIDNNHMHYEPDTTMVLRAGPSKKYAELREEQGREPYDASHATREHAPYTEMSDLKKQTPVVSTITYEDSKGEKQVSGNLFFYDQKSRNKAFSMMPLQKGMDLDAASKALNQYEGDYNEVEYNLKNVIEIFDGVLTAYKNQIQDKNWVHRDIKPANIMVDLGEGPPYLNPPKKIVIFDRDDALKLGQDLNDTPFGSLGYKAPEVPETLDQMPPVKVSTKRDIFALGMTLIGFINPLLHVQNPTDHPDALFNEDSIVKKQLESAALSEASDDEELVGRAVPTKFDDSFNSIESEGRGDADEIDEAFQEESKEEFEDSVEDEELLQKMLGPEKYGKLLKSGILSKTKDVLENSRCFSPAETENKKFYAYTSCIIGSQINDTQRKAIDDILSSMTMADPSLRPDNVDIILKKLHAAFPEFCHNPAPPHISISLK